MTNLQLLWSGVLVAIVIAIGAYFFPQQAQEAVQLAGSVGTRFPNGLAVGSTASVTQNKLTIGNSGTALGNVISANCALIGTDVSQAASSTVPYDCAVTNVTSSFRTWAQIATSTPFKTLGGWDIVASKASTTAGYVTVLLSNNTEAAAVPSVTGVGSSTSVWAVQ